MSVSCCLQSLGRSEEDGQASPALGDDSRLTVLEEESSIPVLDNNNTVIKRPNGDTENSTENIMEACNEDMNIGIYQWKNNY